MIYVRNNSNMEEQHFLPLEGGGVLMVNRGSNGDGGPASPMDEDEISSVPNLIVRDFKY